MAQMVKRLSTMRETWFDPWVGKIPWKRKWQPTPVLLPRNPMDGGAWCRLLSMGSQRIGTTEQLYFHFHFPVIIQVSHGDVMSSMVTIVNNTVLHI